MQVPILSSTPEPLSGAPAPESLGTQSSGPASGPERADVAGFLQSLLEARAVESGLVSSSTLNATGSEEIPTPVVSAPLALLEPLPPGGNPLPPIGLERRSPASGLGAEELVPIDRPSSPEGGANLQTRPAQPIPKLEFEAQSPAGEGVVKGPAVSIFESSEVVSPLPAVLSKSSNFTPPSASTLAYTIDTGAGQALSASVPAATTLAARVQDPQWSEAFANRVSWLVKDGVQSASLKLNPPELGRVDVRISLRHGEATIQFVAHHELARDAIEAAMPRLHQMLDQSGLNLTNVNVFSQLAKQSGQQPFDESGTGDATVPDDAAGADDTESAVAPMHEGLIDQYA